MSSIQTSEKPQQVKSKKRVSDHGEVFTNPREVNAMLDLVKAETEKIDSKFLEPACGDGNFLEEILRRKLAVVKAKYKRSQFEYGRNSLIALGSIYGIEILPDNAESCRKRLLNVFKDEYKKVFKNKAQEETFEPAKFILSKNIVTGDALTMKTVSKSPKPIVFSEWSPVNGFLIKRRDYCFEELVEVNNIQSNEDGSLFAKKSDIGTTVYLPKPVKEFPVRHFLKIQDDK